MRVRKSPPLLRCCVAWKAHRRLFGFWFWRKQTTDKKAYKSNDLFLPGRIHETECEWWVKKTGRKIVQIDQSTKPRLIPFMTFNFITIHCRCVLSFCLIVGRLKMAFIVLPQLSRHLSREGTVAGADKLKENTLKIRQSTRRKGTVFKLYYSPHTEQ